MPQLFQLAVLLLSNAALAQQHKASCNHSQTEVLKPIGETFSENKKRRQGFDQPRKAIPHTVNPENVALFESSDEEVYDTGISEETSAKIRELTLARKELELKVTQYLKER
jgi:hypothetical protein